MEHQIFASDTIKIRVIHRRESIEFHALNLVKIMQASGYRLVSRSQVKPSSRLPRLGLGDGIVYLQFQPVNTVDTVDTTVDTQQGTQLELPLTVKLEDLVGTEKMRE